MHTFPSLNLPAHPLKIKEAEQKWQVFDALRKKWLVLTPEEWVRQHMVHYLITEKKYPKALFKLEGGLRLNTLQKRSDIVVFDKTGNPFLLVECKATSVKLTQAVFEQIAAYNTTLKVKYLVVSNGLEHYCCSIDYDTHSYQFIAEIPVFE